MSTIIASVVAISEDPEFVSRAQALADSFHVSCRSFTTEEDFSDKCPPNERQDFIVISAIQTKTQQEAAGKVQVAKMVSPKANIVVVAEKKVTAEQAQFIKKSGALIILLEDEYFLQSKIEFVFSQKAHGKLVPVKSSELVLGKPVSFSVLHLMPLNHKILPILTKGQLLDEAKQKKMNDVGEFYIERDDFDAYAEYINQHQDKSAKGLKSRCRAKFQNLVISYKELVSLISDRSEMASFKQGKTLLDKCRVLAQDLVASLAESGDAMDVINVSAIDDMSPLDRAPAIAAYAGMFSLMAEIGKPDDVMIAAMLSDIALLELAPKAVAELRTGGVSALKGEALELYLQHPLLSLNTSLARKLPLPETLKNVILAVHERPDGRGFPNQTEARRIPAEAQLIQFCERLDRETIVEFGKERISSKQAASELIRKDLASADSQFSPQVLGKLRPLVAS